MVSFRHNSLKTFYPIARILFLSSSVLLLDYHSSRQPGGEGGLRASSCPHGVWPHPLERKRNEQWNDQINCLLPDPFFPLSILLSRRNLGAPRKLFKHISPQ